MSNWRKNKKIIKKASLKKAPKSFWKNPLTIAKGPGHKRQRNWF